MDSDPKGSVSDTHTTAGKEKQTQTDAHQLQLAVALEAAAIVTWEWDIQSSSIRYSDNIQTIIRGGDTAPYCSLDTLMQRLHPEDREPLTQALDQAIKEGNPFECEYRVQMLDGSFRWILGKGKTVVVEDGKPVRVLGLSMDITERKEAEESLRRSEALYRAIGESIDYGVWVCAPDGRNLYASESFLKLVGLSQKQCSGFGWGSVLHPDDAARTVAAWKECCRTQGIWDIEHRYRGVDGAYHAILARGVPVKNEQGEVVCWAGINLDVSRLRRAQEAIHASEARFRLLADTAARLLATRDPQNLVNQLCGEVMRYLECQVFLNYVAEDTAGSAAGDWPASGSTTRLHLNAYAGISEETARGIEWRDYDDALRDCMAQNGGPVVTELIEGSQAKWPASAKGFGLQTYCLNPLLSEGSVIGTLAFGTTTRPRFSIHEVETMRAIADLVAVALRRMKMRNALETSRAEALNEKNRLAAVMETLPVGLCILDARGGVVRTNRAYDEVWGRPQPTVHEVRDYAAFEARWVATGKPVQPEEWASARAVQHGETVVNQELQIRRFDGSQAYVLNSAAPICDAQNRIVGCAVAIRDITDYKLAEVLHLELELEVQRARKEESLGVLAGGIAHDFNNLLTVIMSNIVLGARDLPAGSGGRKLLGKGEEACRHAADLCQQMLAYVGKSQLSFRPVHLNQLLQGMTRLIEASLSRSSPLRWNLANRLPPIQADPSRVQRIIMNLLINASEAIANQPGEITVTTGSASLEPADLQSPWLEKPLPAGDYVFVEVTDTGCGIEPSAFDRLFEPFYSTKFTGRGLGLAAVLGIVRSHRGTVQVRSAPGHGSTFRVWLPALAEEVGTSDRPGSPV